MSLVTAHKILISASILFFAGLTAKQILLWRGQGSGAALAGAITCGAAAVALAIYLRHFLRSQREEQQP